MAGVVQPVENKENEDGERLMNCLDLLIAAGYFRARIKGLATFDKIVGGMVWCLSHCSRSVDADLLFAENLDIGQKISLTEKIVQVMTVLKCPHSIEPHQIQGLDLENIYPAIQWLVRMAMDSKASRAQFLNSYIDYQYNKVCMDNTVPDIWKSYEKLHESVVPQRKFKRGENLMINSLLEDARCTLAEYSGRSIEVERAGALEGGSATVFHSNGLQELSEGNRLKVSTKTAKKVFEAIDRSDLRSREASRGKKNADELENAKAYLRELDKEIESHKKLLAGVNEEYERLGKTLKYQEETLSRFTSEEIREASDAVENYERVKKVEREFKKRYGAELAALENQVTLREEALEDILLMHDRKNGRNCRPVFEMDKGAVVRFRNSLPFFC
ncbi:hypothetical protein Q1695_012433 [Nippostrongylus brasiliensis]|nr:hypothetical protein Q1695_012433 [Nippostrongylus brasiliensis]